MIANELIIKAKESEESMEEILHMCKGLIVSRIRKPVPPLSFDDLVQVGTIGVIEAVHSYDPSKNTKFMSYATFYINKNIKREILRNNQLSAPTNTYVAAIDVKRYIGSNPLSEWDTISRYIKDNYKRWTGASGICRNETIDGILRLCNYSSTSINLETEDGDNEFEIPCYDSLVCYELDNILLLLEPLDRSLLCMRYFLGMTLGNIGKMFSRSDEWVRIRVNKAIGEIKKVCDERNLSIDDFIIELI